LDSTSRSVFHRIRASDRGRAERFEPDYPLVFFILFSRISIGFGFAGAFLYFLKTSLSFYPVLCAFLLMVLATILSLTHLATPFRFYRVLRNPLSHLTLEIYLSSLYLGVLFLVLSNEVVHVGRFYNISAVLIASSAFAFLLGTAFAYRFVSHPLWNTMRLFPCYLSNGVAFAFFILSLASLIYSRGDSTIYLLSGALSVTAQLISAYYYISFVRETSAGAWVYLARDRSGLSYWWLILNFVLPLAFSCLIPIAAPSRVFVICGVSVILLSMALGVFVERLLFFFVEKPVFFFNTELRDS
jgi:DMSO reductase anchor subunit